MKIEEFAGWIVTLSINRQKSEASFASRLRRALGRRPQAGVCVVGEPGSGSALSVAGRPTRPRLSREVSVGEIPEGARGLREKILQVGVASAAFFFGNPIPGRV